MDADRSLLQLKTVRVPKEKTHSTRIASKKKGIKATAFDPESMYLCTVTPTTHALVQHGHFVAIPESCIGLSFAIGENLEFLGTGGISSP